MARITVRAELAAVNVCVAVRAFLAYIGEHQFDMALRALHLFVHSAERVVSFVVIEFRDAADRLPTQRRMTIFAGNV